MGRWSQYRHRGRGNPAVALAPPADEAWTSVDSLDATAANDVVDPGSAPALQWQVRVEDAGSGIWTESAVEDVHSTIDLGNGGVGPHNFQARWCDIDANPVSDWSGNHFLDLS